MIKKLFFLSFIFSFCAPSFSDDIEALTREIARQERIANQLEQEYLDNIKILESKEESFIKELGSLINMITYLEDFTAKKADGFSKSLTSPEFGDERIAFLKEFSLKMSEKNLPEISELEMVWFNLFREIVASQDISSFKADVVNLDGRIIQCYVVRVGLINAVCGGDYLKSETTDNLYHMSWETNPTMYASALAITEAQEGEIVDFAIGFLQ